MLDDALRVCVAASQRIIMARNCRELNLAYLIAIYCTVIVVFVLL